jgi:hypothetical protein
MGPTGMQLNQFAPSDDSRVSRRTDNCQVLYPIQFIPGYYSLSEILFNAGKVRPASNWGFLTLLSIFCLINPTVIGALSRLEPTTNYWKFG